MANKLDINQSEIEQKIAFYLKKRSINGRISSFDICFNYFQEFFDSGSVDELVSDENLEMSCVQLGFYLASWGMYRGSSEIRNFSAHSLAPVVSAIANVDPQLWKVDVDSYTTESINLIIDSMNSIGKEFPHAASLTLKTKTVLGVFGCVPAFDTYFVKNSGLRNLNSKSLTKLQTFYEENSSTLERLRKKTHTLDFNSGEETHRLYTKAKMIDMIFFVDS